MAYTLSMWVPGHAVAGQQPDINAKIVRNGDSALFYDDGGEHWFQFPIPTPTRQQGYGAPTLLRVMVLFSSDQYTGPYLTRVDAWHGNAMVLQGNDLNLAGTKWADGIYAGENLFDVDFKGVNWGIGISVRVQGAGEAGAVFQFVSAGADFYFPDA